MSGHFNQPAGSLPCSSPYGLRASFDLVSPFLSLSLTYMASRIGREELAMVGKRYQDRETSPERTKVWVEPHKSKVVERKVPVVYYLSRNGLLEHPHFMEVPLSSPQGLYLRDVINRLNLLRGQGMANMYAWSSKRNYKKGFVWHDLSDDDFIYPAQGQEYVLKGSELLLPSPADSISPVPPPNDAGRPTIVSRRNQAWNHQLDLAEYKVYKAETAAQAGLKAAEVSTQTDDKARRRRRQASGAGDGGREEEAIAAVEETVLSTEEISPPPSTSSPETLESLIKTDQVRMAVSDGSANIHDRTTRDHPSGRMKASTVLMQLISCGSISVKDHGMSLSTQYKDRIASQVSGSESVMDGPDFCRIRLENKEYFSGSLVETTKKGHVGSNEELIWLKRSSSYNADRSSKLDLMEKGVTAKCIPSTTKSKSRPNKKDTNSAICRGAPSSKTMTEGTAK